MDNVYAIGPHGELYHWGIKGQKWGIRRYQNKDGSLTPAGKKRYNAEMESLKAREKEIKGREKAKARQAKIDAKKAELDEREKALNGDKVSAFDKWKRPAKLKAANAKAKEQSKPISEMTDDELREMTNRMQLEKNYLDAQKNLAAATPKQVSMGKQVMDKYGDKIIESMIIEPGKKYVTKIVDQKLGINVEDPLKKLENEWKKFDYEKKIAEAKRDIKKANNPEAEKPNYENENKRLQYEDTKAKAETNRLNRDIERMKAEKAHAEQKKIYDEWLEEERRRREQADD